MANKQGSFEFAVIGLGRFGSSLALTLMEHGHTVLGIDRSLELVQKYADQLTRAAAIDSTDEMALVELDLPGFDTVVVAIGQNFEANLLTTVALKHIGAKTVICKALSERQKQILLKVGANRVVLPEAEAGERLGHELVGAGVLQPMLLGVNHSINELRVPRSLVGQTVQGADFRRRFELSVLAVHRREQMHISPSADFELENGDLLVVLGTNANIARLAELP